MKPFSLLCLFVLLLAGCNSFSRLQYRKLNKVPAHPLPAETIFIAREKKALVPEISSPANEIRLPVIEPESAAAKKETVPVPEKGIQKQNHSFIPATHFKNKIIRTVIPVKRKVERKIQNGNLAKEILTALLLILALLLVLGGIGLFVVAFFLGPAWGLVLLGLAAIIAGFLPILGVVLFSVGDRTPSEINEFEERK